MANYRKIGYEKLYPKIKHLTNQVMARLPFRVLEHFYLYKKNIYKVSQTLSKLGIINYAGFRI